MKIFETLRKRGLALILVLTMCLSVLQVTAFAEDGENTDAQPPEQTTGETGMDPEDSRDEETEEGNEGAEKTEGATTDGGDGSVDSMGSDGETNQGTMECETHTWGEWIVTEESTCSKSGSRTRTCEVCEKTETQFLALLNHTWGEFTVTKEATATEKGEKVHTCTVCGAEETLEIPVDAAGEGVFTVEKLGNKTYVVHGSGVFDGTVLIDGEKRALSDLGYNAISKLILDEGITAIADDTFTNYYVSRGLNEVVLPTTCTSIGARAFQDGTLETINLDYVTSIGTAAFAGNGNPVLSGYGKGLTELTIPANLANIGENAFGNMQALGKVVIEEGVTSIGNNAFGSCPVLETVVVPSTLESIGSDAFSNCRMLSSFGPEGTEEGVAVIDGATIGKWAFNSTALKTFRISNVDSIGEQAFYSNTVVENLVLTNVGSLGKYAFRNCYGLRSAILNNVAVPDSAYAFHGSGAEGMTLDVTNSSLGKYAFWNCNVQTATLRDMNTTGQYAFYQCPALETVNLETVTTVGNLTFFECKKLTAVNGLDAVQRIDGFAFYGCENLTGLTVEDATKMGFNGNYGDVMGRVESILKGEFKLDAAPGIIELAPEEDWAGSSVSKSENWNTYQDGTQLVEQARWTDSASTEAEVKVDAYYTAEQQMDYIFVADLSASMAQLGNANDQNSRFYDMQSKLLDMTSQLLGSEGYDCRVAIVTFGGLFGTSETVDPMPFTGDAATAREHIESLEPLYENTDYGLGLNAAYELAAANTGRNTVVVFLSDGQPTANGSGDQAGTTAAASIKALNVPIYGVLHSPGTGDAYTNASNAMKAVCDYVYESTDTKSFGEAMNDAFTAVYGAHTVTIPVNADFENVHDLTVSTSSGEAGYDSGTHTITWTITGMPFTKHTLTYSMSLTQANADREGSQTYDVNADNAGFTGGASVETPVLTRFVPVTPTTAAYTIRHEYYTNGTLTGYTTETSSAEIGSAVSGSSVGRILTYDGISYSFTSAPESIVVLADGSAVITLRYDRTVYTPAPAPTPTPAPGGTTITPTPTPTTSAPADETDIDDGEVPLAAPGLNTVDHFDYIKGYGDGTVRPDSYIKRSEVATIFFRLMTEEFRSENWATENAFSDVGSGDWYNNAISTAAQAGILRGYDDGSFRPGQEITRAEFAAIAARFASDVTPVSGMFSDIEGHWAQEDIERAAAAGWIQGSNGLFRPDDKITRAEAITLINRMLDRVPDEDHLLEDMIVFTDNEPGKWYYADVQEATNSHDYDRDEIGVSEVWSELLAAVDWTALEKEWATADTTVGVNVAENLTGGEPENETSAED